MANIRLNTLWKKAAAALVKLADGRVRPVKDWTELTAPESESPEGDREMPDVSESDAVEPASESQHSTQVELDAPGSEEMLSGVTKLPGGEWAVSHDPDYLFQQQEKSRAQELSGEGIEDSMLLDPSERKRVVELFQKWDPEFLAKPHKATGVPAAAGREQTMVKNKQEELAEKHADVVKRLEAEEGKKGKNPAAIKKLYKELDAVIAEMSDFNKKYSKESQEAERLKGLENLAEGETSEERAQTAPHQFPGEFEKSPDADKKMEKELADFTAAGGLFGKLMSKKDDKLNDLEKGNLGVVLQGLGSLLSKRQLNHVTVRKLISALRALTGKFAASIKSDSDLSDKVSDVAYIVNSRNWAPGEGQSESSARASWHGNDPLKISIISRLQVHAGGKSHSLRDKMVGKKPENITRTRGLTPADISTGTSTFSPRSAFESLVLKGPARPGFDKALADAASGDADAVFASAGAEAYELLKDEYASLHAESHGEFRGTLTKEHVAYDPANPEGKAEQPIARDLKASFVAEYSQLAGEVLSHIQESAGKDGDFKYSPDGPAKVLDDAFGNPSVDPDDAEAMTEAGEESRRKYEEYSKTTGVQPFIKDRTREHMQGMEEALRDVEFNEETGKYELKPEPKESESRELSEEEKAAKAKDTQELREKLAKPLTREVLYDKSGELRDVKDLFAELPEDKWGDLHVILQDELAAAKATAGAEELAEQLSDSIEQLDRMMAPRE